MSLATFLGLRRQQAETTVNTLSKFKTVSEFLNDAIEAFRETSLVDAISRAAPWAGVVAESAAEAVPPIKFLSKLLSELTEEKNPEVLGFLACTLAYERAVQRELPFAAATLAKRAAHSIQTEIRHEEPNSFDLDSFSFENALEHSFIMRADRALSEFAARILLTEEQTRKLIGGVHTRFVGTLKNILADKDLAGQFEPFIRRVNLGTNEIQAYRVLAQHAEYQRWLFEEAPVFGREPFALSSIYIETECGRLTWSEITKVTKDGRHVDPFNEQFGGREPLLNSVMDLIGDGNFRDAIVIQGAAGSGKSTFTLRLSAELLRVGLRPIRIRLKDLRLDLHVRDAIPLALRLGESPEDQTPGQVSADDIFLSGGIFREHITYGATQVCPYVLIFDGWDEVSVSATEGFRVRVARMLDQIRSEYVLRVGPPIRIILTGRPSADVSESNFLRERTPIFTVRPLSREQLEEFVWRLVKAYESHPIAPDEEPLPINAHRDAFAALIQSYRGYDDTVPYNELELFHLSRQHNVEVLGSPLLAHLAVRLVAEQGAESAELLSNPTNLYRSLVDLTCMKAGKAPYESEEVEGQARILGNELRSLLRRTAAAMTVYGVESISFKELALRLDLTGEELHSTTQTATKHDVLSSLMISFYFKGGYSHLGCEFMHKSFREYLFAEEIVETVKSFGIRQPNQLPERKPYWREFELRPDDSRYEMSREISKLLAPQWLTREVCTHIENLLEWEFTRIHGDKDAAEEGRTQPLDLSTWKAVRDHLADLWDWWADGVHLRPQPKVEGIWKTMVLTNAYAHELVEWSLPLDPEQRNRFVEPRRTTAVDAHLGDGLYRLCAQVHFGVAAMDGWIGEGEQNAQMSHQRWENATPVGQGPRNYQTLVSLGTRQWTLFAPSGKDPRHFAFLTARINAAGWRPQGVFPLGVDNSGMDFREISLRIPIPEAAPTDPTRWRFTNLSNVNAMGCFLDEHDFTGCAAYKARFNYAFLRGSIWDHAYLKDSSYADSDLIHARFDNAYLIGVRIEIPGDGDLP